MNDNVRQIRRDDALDRIVDHLLDHGLGQVSLRKLAEATGTSDRMLLYYFVSKEALMLEVFERVVERQSRLLDELLPPGRHRFAVLLSRMWDIVQARAYGPYMRIWYDALGHASRGETAYRAMANRVLESWFDWFEKRCSAPSGKRADEIAAVVAATCGIVMLRYLGKEAEALGATRALTGGTPLTATAAANAATPGVTGRRRAARS